MQLPPRQVERFYRIWFPLLHYVNKQQHLTTTFPDDPRPGAISSADAVLIRNALWADDALRESFIATNPAKLPPADLALVDSWRYRVPGSFFIVRHLKKYSVFLSEGSETKAHAYGVLGLVSPIEDIVGPTVPLYTKAVLLPFEGQIIYDSLLEPFSVSFGPGIRGSINDTYRNVQEREGIITTLDPTEAPVSMDEVRKGVLARNAKILNAFQKDLARRGLSFAMVERHVGNIQAFAQVFLLPQDPPRGLLDMQLADVQTYISTAGEKANPTSFKRFVRFLADSGRMDYDRVEALRDYLRSVAE
jgi:hypothetical protein